MSIIIRLYSNKNIGVLGELYEVEPAFDDTEQIDDQIQLDDIYQFDDEQGIESLLSYLFSLSVFSQDITDLRISTKGDLITPEFVENTGTNIQISTTKQIKTSGELIELTTL